MDPARHLRVSELFLEAADYPPERRAKFLAERCLDDPSLIAEVESLLAHARPDTGSLLPRGIAVPGATLPEGPAPWPAPERIGPYRLDRTLGDGGMGVVYLAEQTEPIHRWVALKLIKPGMDTSRVIARFSTERQALALMSHPNIARVFDAGATHDGHPYFVMEYVEGMPITDHCDAERVSVAERLGLFVQVCEGAQHAQQKGIIHRDIKPSNVLVAVQDGKAIPKIIDFGVAKAVGGMHARGETHTEAGHLLGTPEYMSPEQADLTTLDIDARTDVYSLGMLLYVLLAGKLPLDFDALRKRGLDAMRRAIREDPHPAPSRRVANLGAAADEIAGRRGVEPRALIGQIRKDLDWIVAKATDKERTRRYASPSELAADVRRHLGNEPVLAGPPSAAYRMERFVRRHKVGVAVAAVLALTLMGGIAATSIALIRAVEAEKAAVAARNQASEEAKRAEGEARTAGQVTDFLVDLFSISDPSETRGNKITAREVLDRGAERIDLELHDQPRIRARLLETMGRVYKNLGLYEKSRSLLEDALRIREATASPSRDLDIAASLESLGNLLKETGRYDSARELYLRALDLRQRAPGLDDLAAAATLNNLGTVQYEAGNLDEARRLFELGLGIREKLLPGDSLDVATSRMNLGIALSEMGETEPARQLLERAKEVLQAKSPRSSDLAQILDNLGALHAQNGELDAAKPLFRSALAIREDILGPNHPDVAVSLNNLANLLLTDRDYASARPLYERAIRTWEGAEVPEHTYAAYARNNLASLLVETGHFNEARRLHDQAMAIITKQFGPDHPYLAEFLEEYSGRLSAAGRKEEAARAAARARELRARNEGAPARKE